jgi:hypothetical protein
MTITVDGLDTVERALGDLKQKTPAATKVAINATAREARKLMIDRAKARYAANVAGQRRLKELAQRKRATNKSLSAEIYIASMRNDLGYFRTNPPYPTHYTGTAWMNGPDTWTGKVLKSSSMTPLPGDAQHSKAFLMEFKSGHVGMVQRQLGSSSSHTTTEKGYPRWRNSVGKVEKLETVGSPSATAMHSTIWPEAEPDVEEFLHERLATQVQKVLAKAGRA